MSKPAASVPTVRASLRRRPLRRIIPPLVVTAVATASMSSASPAAGRRLPQAASAAGDVASCSARPYTYAGVENARHGFGVRAAVTALADPEVGSGHVGAWVGVGGPGQGPSGTREWIQAGLGAFSGGGRSVYYEVALPGRAPTYTELQADLVTGRTYRLAVLEIAHRLDWWRVWVDGRSVSPPIHLPASHGRWAPIATAESWTGGAAICNAYRFRFAGVNIALRPGGSWRVVGDHFAFSDAGYRLIATAPGGFIAARSAAAPPVRRLVTVGG